MKKISSTDAARRLANLPSPIYQEDLPVIARREEIMSTIQQNQVVIVCGETGSGKTTQLPKICLELKRGAAGMIGHTQPRRIAARTVASRIASELNSSLGHAVGYKVRFADKVNTDTYVKLMTDGILLAETQGDPMLQAYDTLIIDEAHERSLNIDFLLGYIHQLLPKRPDLKLIVTSATIDAQRFSRHFNDAPVIEVTGRMYPVDIRYRPISIEDNEGYDIQQAILDAVDEVAHISMGDVLIFFPGEREIRETAESLRKHHFDRTGSGVPSIEILPLFARLSIAEQERVFKSGGSRRIVLATNVAETSLTVPGIRYVIDPGWVRINRYSFRNKVAQLQVEKISRASANQRAGRCGRVASGVCIRLYSEVDYHARAEFTDPEILRSSLAAVILRMKSLKIGEVENFPFLEPPSSRMIIDGYQLLMELGAVDKSKRLTRIGWQLAKFPIDPRIARMILAAKNEKCLSEMLIITAALSLQDPRDRPFDRQEAADKAHLRFQDERSDFISYLKLWAFFEECLKHKKSNRKLTLQCQEHFLSHRRMREWREIYSQLRELVRALDFKLNQVAANYDEIHRALLAGLLGNIGFKTGVNGRDSEYLGARGIKFAVFPGSVLKKGKAKWVVAAELVETTKLYGRCAAKIDSSWLENIAGSLCKKHYFNPHWELKQAQVIAYEHVTLYGLTIVPKRRVHYGKINPTESREIFIRTALVAGEYVTSALFFSHNKALLDEVEALEHKARRQDVLVDEQEIFIFYNAIIPAGIVNGAGFEKWRKKAEQDDAHLLYLSRENLMRHAADGITEAQFPETMALTDGSVLPLSYRFELGHVLDGVTVTVPLPLLNQLDSIQFDYLVPGLIREKITWFLKALPKQIRRHLVPLPESVTLFLQRQEASVKTVSLFDMLTKFILRKTATPVPEDIWQNKEPPPHLLMNFRVVDDSGQELAMSRNLLQLREKLGQAAQLTFSQPEAGEQIDIERDNIKRWDFGDLPVEFMFVRMNKQLIGYPALVDQEEHVAIRVLDTPASAEHAMRGGVRRLLLFEFKDRMKQLEKNLPGLRKITLQLATHINPGEVKQDMLATIIDQAFIAADVMPRSEQEFIAYKQLARLRLSTVTDTLTSMMKNIGDEYQSLMMCLSTVGSGHHGVCDKLNTQLGRLIYPGFLNATQWERLQNFPRYLRGMSMRLEKFSSNPKRDEQYESEISVLWSLYSQRLDKHRKSGIDDPSLTEFRWQIEELRISLFSQELKTPRPVSIKRLQKLWALVRE